MAAIYCEAGHFVGSVNRQGADPKFCTKCGSKAHTECPKCKGEIPLEGGATPQFCPECGEAYPWKGK